MVDPLIAEVTVDSLLIEEVDPLRAEADIDILGIQGAPKAPIVISGDIIPPTTPPP